MSRVGDYINLESKARETAEKLHRVISKETELDRRIEESCLKIETQIILSALEAVVAEKDALLKEANEALEKIARYTDAEVHYPSKIINEVAHQALASQKPHQKE